MVRMKSSKCVGRGGLLSRSKMSLVGRSVTVGDEVADMGLP